jgi:riboflavin kinase/FMN adenylyltransferase
MQIIRQLTQENYPRHNRTVLTIGSYDGVHLGHKRIINQLKQAALACNASSALITFYPRPKVVLAPSSARADYLTTVEEKLFVFEELGLDIVAVLPFTHKFAQIPARNFIQQVVKFFHPVELWVGQDFKLGKDRQGDIPYLKLLGQEFDFSVKVVDLQTASDEIVSSTRIRAAMARGQIREVTRLLGRYPFLLGRVVPGAQRGQTIGFPTANIVVDKEKLLPANGVYAVWIYVSGKRYSGVANIGIRPTFDEHERTVEVHIFDFQQDIYGEVVRLELVDYLRSEQKFEDLSALVDQISQDAQQAREILSADDREVKQESNLT